MSTNVVVYRVDDLALLKDPEAEVLAERTITFALGDDRYEIDLTGKNADKFERQIAPYVAAARQIGPRRRPRPAGGRKRSAEIRQWAREHGREISNRGRIPAGVAAEFLASKHSTAA